MTPEVRDEILRLLDGIEEVFSPYSPTPEALQKVRNAVAVLKDLVRDQ